MNQVFYISLYNESGDVLHTMTVVDLTQLKHTLYCYLSIDSIIPLCHWI